MQVSPLVWNENLIIKFWDYYSHFPEKYFTYQFGSNIVNELSKEVGIGSKILDYGCGTGYLIKHLVKKEFEIYGAETSSASVEFVNIQYKESTNFKGAFLIEDLFKLDRKFDVIFVVEVIEHLDDGFFISLIRNVKNLLNPGGKIIFTTPNNENLEDSIVYCPVCDHTFHRWQHVRSWSAASLSSYLEKNGLDVTKCYGTDFSAIRPNGFMEQIKYSLRNYFHSQHVPHLVAVCRLS